MVSSGVFRAPLHKVMIIKDNPSIQKKESVVLQEVFENIYSQLISNWHAKPIVVTDFEKALYLI
jgi:hypothetical protein